MTDTDPKRVRSIFLAAVEDHAPEQWDEYLGQACRGEPELRQRVEVLLRGHKQPNELLDDPGAAPVAPSQTSIGEGPGTLVGPYKLLEQIGEGGFGVVFMAEQQQPVRRKVALKIVKPGMDTRQVVARFEAERQALALMDHPNIAQIFDGGATESGRPFFVMELVRGNPITEFCDRHHLGVRERLELFTHVCQAVQHAHQKGIIHRDLKPSNIMVTQLDVTPVVKIIDFGIAKATVQQLTDKTLFTNFAKMIGTPMYMSPEQAQMSGLDVDTRSDVYSLGVLLYELMTGSTPFDRERFRTVAYDEMIRIIREEEPVRPSTRISTVGNVTNTAIIDRNCTPQKLSQMLRGELDWIVMKTLEKDRNRRYESAGALANEVQRYLNDEPVLACPPTVGYRLKKIARRHKAALATAAIVFAALAVGMGVAVWQAVVATEAKQQALDSAAAEKKAKIAAEEKEVEAQAVISFLEKRVFSTTRPEGRAGGLGYDVSMRRVIEAAVPFVQDGFKDQPLVEARLRMVLGHSFGTLGEAKKSADQFAIARAIYSSRLGPDHESTLKSASCLAWSYNAESRYSEALHLASETVSQARIKLGPEDSVTLDAMDHLASSYDGLGQYTDALNIREELVKIRKATLSPEHPDAIQGLQDLAVSYSYFERYPEALEIEEKVLAIRRAKLGPDHPLTLEILNNVAVTYRELGRVDEAIKEHQYALARRKVRLGPDHPYTIQSMTNLANCISDQERWPEALALHKQALELSQVVLGSDHVDTLVGMCLVAVCSFQVGNFADAAERNEAALPGLKSRLGLNHRTTMKCIHNLAMCYKSLGRPQDALKFGDEAVTRRIVELGADHPETLWSMHNLGVFHSDLHQDSEALRWFQKALAGRTARLGSVHDDTLYTQANVARCLVRLDRSAEAVPIIDDCVQKALKAKISPNLVTDLMYLRMRHFYNSDDVAGCRATAAMWDAMNRTDADSLYGAARARARLADLIRDQDSSAEGEKQSDREADRAMTLLRKAVAAGYKNTTHLAGDAGLDILRKRPDFIRLMAELPPGLKQDEK